MRLHLHQNLNTCRIQSGHHLHLPSSFVKSSVMVKLKDSVVKGSVVKSNVMMNQNNQKNWAAGNARGGGT